MKKVMISFVFGTRPELIKLAPVIRLALEDARFEVEVIFSAQHDELVRDAIQFFDIPIHHRLDMMRAGQSLNQLLSRGLTQIEAVYQDGRARDVIVVQGDTTTVLAAALVGFALKIPVAHVEAGLRSFDMAHPFPEEGNRVLTSRVAHWHFAPTAKSALNLENENVPDDRIVVTGNTVVDAVKLATQSLDMARTLDILNEMGLARLVDQHFILITAHRRENHGEGMLNICRSIRQLALEHTDLHFVWPVHLNPAVQQVVQAELGGLPQVMLLPPLDYPKLIVLLKTSYFVMTDSGGIQEECPSFHKPVLILRTTTERPEVVEVGAGKLVGTDQAQIIAEANALLTDQAHYRTMAEVLNPFGDGLASQRILDRIAQDVLS